MRIDRKKRYWKANRTVYCRTCKNPIYRGETCCIWGAGMLTQYQCIRCCQKNPPGGKPKPKKCKHGPLDDFFDLDE